MMNTETALRHVGILPTLAEDHDRMDHLLAEVLQMVEDGEFERADHTFEELERDLRRHIRFEEGDLFPVFEERYGEGPTDVMREEHRMIAGALVDMANAIERSDERTFCGAYQAMRPILRNHHLKEEWVIFPAVDRLLPLDKRQRLIEHWRTA